MRYPLAVRVLRFAIDTVDAVIVLALVIRVSASRAIGRRKRLAGFDAFDGARESAIVSRYAQANAAIVAHAILRVCKRPATRGTMLSEFVDG